MLTIIVLVSGTILNNVLYNGLKGKLSSKELSKLLSSGFKLDDLHISKQDEELILTVYMKGLRAVFISYAVLASIYFLCSLLVKGYGLSGKDHASKSIIAPNHDDPEEHDS